MNRLPILTLAALLIFGAGCAGTHPQKVVYSGLKAAKDAELAAMESYYSLWHQGKVSAESEVNIEQLHLDFTAAFESAVKIASQDWEGAYVPESMLTSLAAILQAVEAIKRTTP